VERNPVFDELLTAGIPAVRDGSHQRDKPPVDGGRWPVSIVALPPMAARERLAQLMRGALVHAGPGHFTTGRADAVHLTIRALEPFRAVAAPDDPIVADWRAAMERACAATTPFELTLTGVTLTRGGVMAQFETSGGRPWDFMDRLRTDLGDLAWYEERWMRRNIWYASLIHFAADITDPTALIAWVEAHRTISPVAVTVDAIHLVRFRHRPATAADPDQFMALASWFTVPFGRQGRRAPA